MSRIADSLTDWDAEIGVTLRFRRQPLYASRLEEYEVAVRHGALEPWDRFLRDLADRSSLIGPSAASTDEHGLGELRSVFVEVAIGRFLRSVANLEPRAIPGTPDAGTTVVRSLLFRANDARDLRILSLTLPRGLLDELDEHVLRRADEKAREHGFESWIDETSQMMAEARSAIIEALVIGWMHARAKRDGMSIRIPTRSRGRPALLGSTVRRAFRRGACGDR